MTPQAIVFLFICTAVTAYLAYTLFLEPLLQPSIEDILGRNLGFQRKPNAQDTGQKLQQLQTQFNAYKNATENMFYYGDQLLDEAATDCSKAASAKLCKEHVEINQARLPKAQVTYAALKLRLEKSPFAPTNRTIDTNDGRPHDLSRTSLDTWILNSFGHATRSLQEATGELSNACTQLRLLFESEAFNQYVAACPQPLSKVECNMIQRYNNQQWFGTAEEPGFSTECQELKPELEGMAQTLSAS